MKNVMVVYHEMYRQVYAGDPASKSGRIESIYNELREHDYEFIAPEPASEKDLLRVHTPDLISRVKREETFEISALAAGGALKAAALALEGKPIFGLIRPPGHHAGANFNGGFCRFNNIAVAVEKLIQEGAVKKAFVLDIDLHYGNGTEDIFSGRPDIIFINLNSYNSYNRDIYLKALSEHLSSLKGYDILAVSAGFDTYEKDWGGIFSTEDFKTIGGMIGKTAENCQGRIFALLEGGYYIPDLGKNVHAFLKGLKQ
jgi:acetoin utilization deacetylase AcuC-like enzyme